MNETADFIALHHASGKTTEYRGTGNCIDSMDIEEALSALLAVERGEINGRGGVVRDAKRVVKLNYEMVDADEACDCEVTGCVVGDELDGNDLAWAAMRARGGDLDDAIIHLIRALDDYPDAVATLDIIWRKLTS